MIHILQNKFDITCESVPQNSGVMVSKLVLLKQLCLNSEFDPQWVLHTFSGVPHLSIENHFEFTSRCPRYFTLVY